MPDLPLEPLPVDMIPLPSDIIDQPPEIPEPEPQPKPEKVKKRKFCGPQRPPKPSGYSKWETIEAAPV